MTKDQILAMARLLESQGGVCTGVTGLLSITPQDREEASMTSGLLVAYYIHHESWEN